MAAAVTSNPSISMPFHMPSRPQIITGGSSHMQHPTSSTSTTPSPQPPKTINRLRASLEQFATRRNKVSATNVEEFGTVATKGKKGKEKATADIVAKEKDKAPMLRRIESKMFGRSAASPPPA